VGNEFWRWVVELDRVLRGDATKLAAIRDGGIQIPLKGLSVVVVVLGMIYGACMGSFSLFRPDGSWMQIVATTVKVPLLFFLTLVVTFPSLYVFNALVGSRLSVLAVLRLLIAALAVNLAVLSSLGPIVAFFSVSTTSYAFMVLLNVVVFAAAGALGLTFLLQTLNRLSFVERRVTDAGEPMPAAERPSEIDSAAGESASAEAAPEAPQQSQQPIDRELGPLDRLEGQMLGKHVRKVFGTWIVVFGLVGAQMGWVLRPFIGAPEKEFEWFRERESNFFEAVLSALAALFQ
jgi:hypothetical protein